MTKEPRNHSTLVCLTTLSVCFGLALIGSTAPVSGHAFHGNGNVRALVRQSLYGSALEDLVRELEKLGEDGDRLDLEKELALLDADTPLTLVALRGFAPDTFSNIDSARGELRPELREASRRVETARSLRSRTDRRAPRSAGLPFSALPRASLDEASL